jgi:hypothetical protein
MIRKRDVLTTSSGERAANKGEFMDRALEAQMLRLPD